MPATKERCSIIRTELRHFSYVVGTKFFVDVEAPDVYLLRIQRPTSHDSLTRRRVDGYVLEASISIHDDWLFPGGRLSKSVLKRRLVELCRIAELHEMDEWLRYDGKPLHSPHFN